MSLTSDAKFLDPLAACLGAGVPLPDALARIETAGVDASRWVQRVRPFVRPGSTVEAALYAARAISQAEHALLARAVTPDAVEELLHALALRRRQRERRHRAILRGLVGPVLFAALTVILNPLPNLVGNGSYVGPVFSGLLALGLSTAFAVAGVPALLRSPRVGPGVLALCSRLPGLAWLAARHAEAEIVTVLAPFVGRPEQWNEGVLATSTMLAWSPLGERLRAAALAGEATPEWALARLAPHLSLATNLSIVSGIASGQLAPRLVSRGEELDAELTTYLRVGIRVGAYALVVVLSLGSLASMLSRAVPGLSLPGATPSAEQKELDQIMKELEGPAAPAPAPSK